MVLIPSDENIDIQVVGLPRALLTYRYGVLWKTFFEQLGRTVVVSGPTDRSIAEAGANRSVDECCLASKVFMGHVASLIGRCDAVFVPSYASVDHHAGFCTKFQALPDMVRNTFRDEGVRVLSVLVEDMGRPKEIRRAYEELAQTLGARPSDAKRAWKRALDAQQAHDAQAAAEQAKTARQLASDPDSTGILLAAHPYIAHDRYLAGAVVDALRSQGAVVLTACDFDHDEAFKASFAFSETLPWLVNREIIGTILNQMNAIDGIVLVSAFPCGPDSMTDDAIMRYIEGKPILNLMIDAQSGTAGIQTRVESFMDILRFKKKGGYLR